MAYPASEAQVRFITDLAERVYIESAAERVENFRAAGVFDDSRKASALIDSLKIEARNAPRAATATATATATMPEAGYYAVEWNGDLKFYAVREGKGTWEGRRFLNRFRSDYLDRPSARERSEVVALILADPQTARETFARESVCCWHCGRKLTDAVSRARGTGPDCDRMYG